MRNVCRIKKKSFVEKRKQTNLCLKIKLLDVFVHVICKYEEKKKNS